MPRLTQSPNVSSNPSADTQQIFTLMRFNKFIIFLLLTYNLSNSAYGQGSCSFKIDTAKILTNQNLDRLLQYFQTNTFKITNNKKDIPRFIKKELDCLSNGFSLANPGQPFQATDVIKGKRPNRQLTFLAKNKNMLVLTYTLGGFSASRRVLFIIFEGKQIIDLWTGNCYYGFDTKEGIIENINLNRNREGRLNSNTIRF
jgi:hypothetical protein